MSSPKRSAFVFTRAKRWVGLALRRLAELEELFGIRADGEHTGSFDGLANAAIDRFGDPWPSVYVDAAGTGETRIDRWEDDWRGRNDPGGQRGDAIHRSAGHGRKLHGVSHEAGKSERD